MFSALRAIISYKNVFTYLSCELLCCKFSYTALNVICTRRYKLAMQFVTYCKRYSSMKQPKQTIIECTEDKQTIQQINKYMQIRAMAKKKQHKERYEHKQQQRAIISSSFFNSFKRFLFKGVEVISQVRWRAPVWVKCGWVSQPIEMLTKSPAARANEAFRLSGRKHLWREVFQAARILHLFNLSSPRAIKTAYKGCCIIENGVESAFTLPMNRSALKHSQ